MMVIKICPNCQQRFATDKYAGDFVHDCNSNNLVFDEEDVVITSTSIDEFGDSNKSTGKLKGDIYYQGVENEFWGRRPQIYGEDDNPENRRGVNVNTHRQRKYFNYIKDVNNVSKNNNRRDLK